jgi:hypothetical protein
MLYQLHFDNYPTFHRVEFLVQDLIYKHKVKGEFLEIAEKIDDKFGAILNSLPDWGYKEMINHSIILDEKEALFLSEWLQLNEPIFPEIAALQGTLQTLAAAA